MPDSLQIYLESREKCIWKTSMTVGRSRCECASGIAKKRSGIPHLCVWVSVLLLQASFLHVAGNAFKAASVHQERK